MSVSLEQFLAESRLRAMSRERDKWKDIAHLLASNLAGSWDVQPWFDWAESRRPAEKDETELLKGMLDALEAESAADVLVRLEGKGVVSEDSDQG